MKQFESVDKNNKRQTQKAIDERNAEDYMKQFESQNSGDNKKQKGKKKLPEKLNATSKITSTKYDL